MTHVRTIKEAAAYFKAEDEGTCLTETAIRTLVRSGKIASTKVGKKYLVSLETLEDFLQGKADIEEPTLPKQKTAWRVT